ncbi:MAG: S24/S26 family peptidase [Thermoguttaceae bacterium]|nr:S24/S26 family peptidase [Thermoguttaceae bacterium]
MTRNRVVLTPSSSFFALALEALYSEGGEDREVAFTPGGISMLPTLRDRRDTVYLVKPTGAIKKYDVALFRRETGEYVLHRVVKVCRDGTYVFRGDFQTEVERNVRREQILAVMTAFQRGKRRIDCGRSVLYKVYSRAWTSARPVLKLWRACRLGLRRLAARRAK